MDLGLKNKNAASTGASQGIGETVAHALANEAIMSQSVQETKKDSTRRSRS